MYIIFIYKYKEILETVDGRLWVTARCVDVDSLAAVKCPHVKFFVGVFCSIDEVGRAARLLMYQETLGTVDGGSGT